MYVHTQIYMHTQMTHCYLHPEFISTYSIYFGYNMGSSKSSLSQFNITIWLVNWASLTVRCQLSSAQASPQQALWMPVFSLFMGHTVGHVLFSVCSPGVLWLVRDLTLTIVSWRVRHREPGELRAPSRIRKLEEELALYGHPLLQPP